MIGLRSGGYTWRMPRSARDRFAVSCAVLCAGLLAASPGAGAAEPAIPPEIAIELGAHQHSVWQLALDPKGEYFVTASSDRTLRVWSTAGGELLQTLRPPTRPGTEGWFGSVAISPDGATIAAGGGLCRSFETSYCVYLFDRASGALRQRILGFPSRVSRTLFAPDGRHLLALTLTDGVRLVRLEDGAFVGEDRDFGQAPSYTAAMAHDGTTLVAGRDGFLRLYRTQGGRLERIVKRQTQARGSPHAAAFSPDGRKLAVTHILGGNAINILDAKTLDLLYSVDARLGRFGAVSAAWTPDGRTLLAGTSAFAAGQRSVRAYDNEGRGPLRSIDVFAHNVEDIGVLPQGGFIAVARDAAIAAFDAGFRPLWRVEPRTPDYFFRPEALRVARSGLSFALPGGEIAFDPAARRFVPLDKGGEPSQGGELAPPVTQTDTLRVSAWRDSQDVNLDGRRLALLHPGNETSRALSIAPDRDSFILGTTRGIYRFDRNGKRLWNASWPGEVIAVNHALDGRLIVAVQFGGTLRFLRASDGSLVFSAFVSTDRRRWLLYMPGGYYDASLGGEDLAGWLVSRGKLAASDFYPLSRFRTSHYRPAVISAVQSTLDAKEALLKAAGPGPEVKARPPLPAAAAPSGQDDEAAIDGAGRIAAQLPPAVSIVSPGALASSAQREFTLRVSVRTAADAPLTRLRVRIAGAAAAARIRSEPAGAAAHAEITVDLPPEDTQIAVFAENRHGIGAPALVSVKWTGARPDRTAQRNLYVFAVGVSDYIRPEYRLGFAAKDAADLAAALLRQKGGWYARVEARLVTDRQATRQTVDEGFAWLRERVRDSDTAVIFLAGHGLNDAEGNYFFLPADADLDRLAATGVPFTAMRNVLADLPGKTLLMADTCHSGNILGRLRRGQTNDATAALNDLASAENGIVVFASSTGQQVSMESSEWGNGAFTKAVLEGLHGRADYRQRGHISYKMLDLYISDRVSELTRGAQTPVSPAPVGVPDFIVVEVRK